MSRTYKDRGKIRRIVRNSLYKKIVHVWGEDFKHKRKDKTMSRHLRNKIKNDTKKSIVFEE